MSDSALTESIEFAIDANNSRANLFSSPSMLMTDRPAYIYEGYSIPLYISDIDKTVLLRFLETLKRMI